MSYFASFPANAGPPAVYSRFPDVYRPWSQMSQVLMNGPSPLSNGERELILAYAAALTGCTAVYTAHSEVAYTWGIKDGLVDELLDDFDNASVTDQQRPLLAFVRQLATNPTGVTADDAAAVFDAGWDEQALHDAIAITARAAFMQRLINGFGFGGLTREAARSRAAERIEHGYVDLFPAFRQKG
jgi:uncharacterized peroxidase-related enzyme